jgi:dihydrofolate reductase
MLGGKFITIVAAMGRNRAIGLRGELPWHLPRELRHFKETTMGKPIVMGRRTWQSIGRPLPGRQNLVVTRDASFRAAGCEVADSLAAALVLARGEEVMIIGGGQLYGQTLAHADRMVLTLVDCEPPADTWFPEWRLEDWRQVSMRSECADERNPFDYRVIELTRRCARDGTSPAPGTAADPPAGAR